MNTSDIIALLALAVSLISFWLSFRANRFTRILSAAEKRTQSHSVLVAVLIEVQELLSLAHAATKYKVKDVVFPEGLENIEKQLSDMATKISQCLEWLRVGGTDDPVKLEEYKSYALEVESKVKQVGPLIRNLEVHLREGK